MAAAKPSNEETVKPKAPAKAKAASVEAPYPKNDVVKTDAGDIKRLTR